MNKRLKTYVFDVLTITSITIFTTLIFKKLQFFLKTLQEYPQQLSEMSQILMQETLTTYNITQVDAILNQINILTYKTYIYQYMLLPLAFILPYLIFQEINWKLLNKTKTKIFIISSIPFLIIFILFITLLMDFILSFYTMQQQNLIFLIFSAILLFITGYLTITSYILNSLSINNLMKHLKKKLKNIIIPYTLFSLTFLILVLLSLAIISLSITLPKLIIYIVPIILVILIIFNYQRTSLIRKLK